MIAGGSEDPPAMTGAHKGPSKRRIAVYLALALWSALCLEAGAILIISHTAAHPPGDPRSLCYRVLDRMIRPHEECAMCGMTRGLWFAARGRWQEASEQNVGAVPAYAISWALVLSTIPCALLWKRQLVGDSP